MRQGDIITLKARLHHLGSGRYPVLFDGKLLVERSRDPESDAARALLARGYAGKLILCDGKTGKPRTIIDIEKAAQLIVEETANGPRFRRFRGVESAPRARERAGPMPDIGRLRCVCESRL
jgi:hypothetical protein